MLARTGVDILMVAEREGAVNDGVGVPDVAKHAVIVQLERRLAGDVAGDDRSGLDMIGIQGPGELGHLEACARLHPDRKAEPGMAALGLLLLEVEEVAVLGELAAEPGRVRAARIDELRE